MTSHALRHSRAVVRVRAPVRTPILWRPDPVLLLALLTVLGWAALAALCLSGLGELTALPRSP